MQHVLPVLGYYLRRDSVLLRVLLQYRRHGHFERCLDVLTGLCTRLKVTNAVPAFLTPLLRLLCCDLYRWCLVIAWFVAVTVPGSVPLVVLTYQSCWL